MNMLRPRPLTRAALLLFLASCAPAGRATIETVPPPASGAASAETARPADLRRLEPEIRRIIASAADHDTLEVAVAVIDLASGDSLLIDGHTRMHAASTMKVPVMLELFRRAEAGDLDLDSAVVVKNTFTSIADGSAYSLTAGDDSDAELYQLVGEEIPIRSLIDRMITRSSNLATNILIELADPARIAATLEELGASGMHVLRGVEDIPAYERGMNNTTTAHALARVMRSVADGRVVSASATEEMVRILEAQEFRDKIPAGLPPGTRVGNKTGWITAIDHDAAVVFPEDRAPYVLVVLTRGFRDRDASADLARRISRRTWDYLAGPG